MDSGIDERQEAFRVCFRVYWSAVFRYLRRRGADEQAEDLAAEVFTTAWRRWGDVPGQPLPWLLGTARKLLANQRRRQQPGALVGDLSTGDLTYASAETRESLRRLIAALKCLPEPQRELLLLVAW